MRFETKICPPGCLSERLKIGTRPCCGDRCCCPIYPPWGRYSGKTLILEIPGVNAFVCVDNGLPAELPHASPRLKIPMALHWCCRVTPRAGYPVGRYPGKTLVLEKLGVKLQGGRVLVKSKMKIEVRNEDCPPPGCLSQRLKIGTRPCCGDRCSCPIYPRGVGIPGKLLFSRSRGVNAFVCVDNGLPAALPHASPRLKIPMAFHWCCRVPPLGRVPGGRYPGKTLVLEKLGVKCRGGG